MGMGGGGESRAAPEGESGEETERAVAPRVEVINMGTDPEPELEDRFEPVLGERVVVPDVPGPLTDRPGLVPLLPEPAVVPLNPLPCATAEASVLVR